MIVLRIARASFSYCVLLLLFPLLSSVIPGLSLMKSILQKASAGMMKEVGRPKVVRPLCVTLHLLFFSDVLMFFGVFTIVLGERAGWCTQRRRLL